MLSTTPGSVCYLQITNDLSNCIMYSAAVIRQKDNSYKVELEEDSIPFEDGQSIFVYYTFEFQYKCQLAKIIEITDTPLGFVIIFEFIQDPVSKEGRKCYRVSTVMTEVTATFADEINCQVVDVCATGFALIAAKRYKTTEIIDIAIQFEDESFVGRGRIQTARVLSDRRIRYGMLCLTEKINGESLRKGLQKICSEVQRQHLKRLSQAS